VWRVNPRSAGRSQHPGLVPGIICIVRNTLRVDSPRAKGMGTTIAQTSHGDTLFRYEPRFNFSRSVRCISTVTSGLVHLFPSGIHFRCERGRGKWTNVHFSLRTHVRRHESSLGNSERSIVVHRMRLLSARPTTGYEDRSSDYRQPDKVSRDIADDNALMNPRVPCNLPRSRTSPRKLLDTEGGFA